MGDHDPGAVAPTRLLEAIGVLRRELAEFDPARLSGTDAATLAEELARTENACAAARLLAGARAVACGAHKQQGVFDPARWMARQKGTTGREARQGLELAKSLESHPKTKAALLEGQVSVAQAKEITAAAKELPGAEAALLHVARTGDLGQLRDAAREKRLSGTPVEDLHRRQVQARWFRHFRDGLGMVRLEAALPPESGIPLVTRIEREAARLRDAPRRHGPVERFEAYAADAFIAAFANGADAPTRRQSTDLVIVCDLLAWRRGHAHEGEPCHLLGGGPIPVEVAKELGRDAFLKAVVHDGKDVLKVRHFGRRYTAELRTALDLGPVPAFSGRACAACKRTFGLERDHVEPIAANGRTSIDNVQDLCYPCHQEKTERDRRAGLLGEKAKARRPGPPRRPAPASGSTASGPPEAHPSAPEMSTADPP